MKFRKTILSFTLNKNYCHINISSMSAEVEFLIYLVHIKLAPVVNFERNLRF